jgi:hypothetical protein
VVQKLPKITATGTHDSAYGKPDDLPEGMTLSPSGLKGFRSRWLTPLILFLCSLIGFSLVSWNYLSSPSDYRHFAFQAEAFLAGQAELLTSPPNQNDWASYSEYELLSGEVVQGTWYNWDERKFLTLEDEMMILELEEIQPQDRGRGRETRHYFVSFPPGPAVLMMPFVAIWGTQINDIWFTLFFASLNIALMYILLRRLSLGGRTARSPGDNLWLSTMMGFGTVYLFCAIRGEVWYTGLIVGITFTLLYFLASMDGKRPLWAGLFLAFAFATRAPLLFTAFLFPAFVLFPGGKFRRTGWPEAIKKIALFCIIPLIVGVSLLCFNYARFGQVQEFGHSFLANGELTRVRDYGLFNYHFLGRNLAAAFTLVPRLQPYEPYVLISNHGMSLLLTTPVFCYLFKGLPKEYREDVFWHRLCWACVLILAVPHFLYQNTGWEQFGYRFSLDYTPFLVALLALGRFPQTRVFRILIVVGIAVNLFGGITFQRFPEFYTDWFFDP